MSVAIGDPVSGGTAHSILFVGQGVLLAQDNASFRWNANDKTLLVKGKRSRITAAVQRGTDTQSLSYQVQEVIANNGSFYIVVKNTGAAAIGTGNPPPDDAATIKIHFKIAN